MFFWVYTESMSIYIVIIALLLGGVTFLGFQVVQAPEEMVSDTDVVRQDESGDTTPVGVLEKEESEVKDPMVSGKIINLRGSNLSKVPGYVFDARSVTTLDIVDDVILDLF